MELSHLLNLVSELPTNTTLSYVRGNDTCKFIDVDIPGERINSESPTHEPKSWAPSYLSELASKIKENVPFNLSGLLNNKGSFRPVLETIIAHTREFYTVRKGTATALVWIPSKPKQSLDLEEIAQEDIPAPKPDSSLPKHLLNKEELIKASTDGFEKFLLLTNKQMENRKSYIQELDKGLSQSLKTVCPTISSIYEIVSASELKSAVSALVAQNASFAYLQAATWNESQTMNPNYKIWTIYRQYLNYLTILESSDFRANIDEQEVSDIVEKPKESRPLQQIFYGAPGTGKSFAIDNLTNDENTVRTTFHPDSDYASFVGAYKPTMEAVPINSIYGESVQYATGKNGHPGTEKKIVYKYVPQAFLKAYVAAWYDLENPHYLVIEEINRGNCAQIFGDLFQLLDRNNSGSSSYAIHADDDIRQFLSTDSKGFANLSEEQKQAIADFVLVKDNRKRSEIGPKILSGELLLLPPNLRIWATMNTSDQSLFPIDSAFKRRWNWHYVPIEYDVKDWLLHVGDNYYRWGDFLRAINPIISELTESPDKQMGYFFAKPDEKHGDTQENNTISEDVFVNKVLFYLWTDVLKDFDAGKEPFLNPDTKRAYEFSDFFDSKHDYLEQFVGKLGISPIDGSEPVDEEATDKGSDYKSIEVSVDGQTETSMTKAMIAILQKAAPTHTFAEIEAAVSECITRGDDPIIKKIDNPAEYTKENRWNTTIIKSSDNIYFVVTTMWQRQFLPMIKKLAQYFNVPFEVVNP